VQSDVARSVFFTLSLSVCMFVYILLSITLVVVITSDVKRAYLLVAAVTWCISFVLSQDADRH